MNEEKKNKIQSIMMDVKNNLRSEASAMMEIEGMVEQLPAVQQFKCLDCGGIPSTKIEDEDTKSEFYLCATCAKVRYDNNVESIKDKMNKRLSGDEESDEEFMKRTITPRIVYKNKTKGWDLRFISEVVAVVCFSMMLIMQAIQSDLSSVVGIVLLVDMVYMGIGVLFYIGKMMVNGGDD